MLFTYPVQCNLAEKHCVVQPHNWWLYKQLGKTHTGLNLSSARYQLMLLGNTYCDEQLATASSLLIQPVDSTKVIDTCRSYLYGTNLVLPVEQTIHVAPH